MKYLLTIALALALSLTISINACKKKKENPGVCKVYSTDSSFLNFGEYYTAGTKYVGLPANYYPINASIRGKFVINGQGNYLNKGLNTTINGGYCNLDLITGLKAGANTLKSEMVNCKGLNTNGLFNCDCPPSVVKTGATIYGIDTVRLWIKKIKFTKQYAKDANEGGGYPDVYLIMDNFGKSTGAKVDYNAATDGAITWNLNDTFTITKNYFNLNLFFYDTDFPLQDDYLGTALIKAWRGCNRGRGVQSAKRKM